MTTFIYCFTTMCQAFHAKVLSETANKKKQYIIALLFRFCRKLPGLFQNISTNANTLLSLVPVNLHSATSPGSMFNVSVWSFSSVESLLCMSLTRTKNKVLVIL